jgi:hypothetical protein
LVRPLLSMDVARAFHWDVCQGWSAERREHACGCLARVLAAAFPAGEAERRFPFYVQGCHDVAGALVLSLGAPSASTALLGLLRGPLRGCVLATMEVPCALLALLPRLLHRGCPTLGRALEAAFPAEDALPHYALPWVLTWFSHALLAFEVVQRLFDAFLLGHPLLPLYASAALLTLPGPRAAILAVLAAHPGDEGALFQLLAALPRDTLGDQRGATALLRRMNAVYAVLPPAALLGPWLAPPAAPGGSAPRHRRHNAALAVLRRLWPEVFSWVPPGGGQDPRLRDGCIAAALLQGVGGGEGGGEGEEGGTGSSGSGSKVAGRQAEGRVPLVVGKGDGAAWVLLAAAGVVGALAVLAALWLPPLGGRWGSILGGARGSKSV